MRIARITVERFGALRDLDIPLPLPPRGGMVVVLGANEAGKSTLLRFLRTLLFGGREPAFGALVVEHQGARYRIAQRGGRATLAVTDLAGGRAADPGALGRLVGHLDAGVYRQVFAFDLSALQQIETLTQEGVQEHIFSAAVQGAGRSVREAQRALAADLERLWRPRSANLLREEARELRGVEGLLRAAEGTAAEYQPLLDEEEDLEARIGERLAEVEGLRKGLRRSEILLELNEPWRRRLKARADLAAAPPLGDVPAEAVERVRALRTGIEVAEQGARDLEAEVRDLERRVAAAVPDERLLTLGPRIAALSSLLAIQRQRAAEDLPQGELAVEEAQALVAASLEAVGPLWSEERVASFAAAAIPAAELERFAEQRVRLRARREEGAVLRHAAQAAHGDEEARVAALRAEGADERGLPAAEAVRALCGELAGHRERLARLERLGVEERQRDDDLDAALARLGAAWDAERVAAFGAHDLWRARAEEARAADEDAADREGRAQAACAEAERQVAVRRRELEGLPAPGDGAGDVERELQTEQAQAAQLEGLAGTLQEWSQSRQEEQAYRFALQGATVSAPRRARLGVLLSVGITLALALWLARAAPLPALALLLAGGALAVLNWPRGASGSAAAAPSAERAQSAYREAVRRTQGLDERRQAEARAAGLPPDVDLGSVHAALRRARDRVAERTAAREAERRRAEAAHALEHALAHLAARRGDLQDAGRGRQEAQAAWGAWREAEGIPPHVRPADIPAFLTHLERSAEILRAVRQRRREREELTAAVDAWRARVRPLSAELLPGRDLPAEEAVSVLQAVAERAARLHAALREAARAAAALAEAGARAADAEEGLAEWQRRWSEWCAAHALPPLEAPEDALSWLSEVRRAQERLAEARARHVRLERLRTRARQWEADAAAVLAEAGRPAAAGGLDLVRALEELAAEQQRASRLKEAQEAARADWAEKKRRLDAQAEDLAERQAALARALADWGVAGEAELRERLAWTDRRRQWQRVVADAEEELRRRTGREADAFAVLLDEDDPLGWEAERTRALARLAAVEDELNAPDSGLRARLAAARTRRFALEASGDGAALRLRREQCRTALEQDLRRWVVRRLAGALIAETLGEYERHHVPEVLRAAGRRFASVTGGRYREVRALDQGKLSVYTAGDDVLDAAALSRGTQEQLYLVVRLGLVDTFARQRESLPLVLDDVLVNADPERREALLRVLVEAARDHQTFFLTCHPEVCAAILRQVPGTEPVRLERIASSAGRPSATAEDGPAYEAAAGAREAAAAGDPPAGAGAQASLLAAGRHRVLQCLRAAGRPLGRQAILQGSGIAEGDWPLVIRGLVDTGLVRQEGAGRGTVYAPAPTGDPPP